MQAYGQDKRDEEVFWSGVSQVGKKKFRGCVFHIFATVHSLMLECIGLGKGCFTKLVKYVIECILHPNLYMYSFFKQYIISTVILFSLADGKILNDYLICVFTQQISRLGAVQVYTVKKRLCDFPVPSRDVTNGTIPELNNQIIPGHGEFGQ